MKVTIMEWGDGLRARWVDGAANAMTRWSTKLSGLRPGQTSDHGQWLGAGIEAINGTKPISVAQMYPLSDEASSEVEVVLWLATPAWNQARWCSALTAVTSTTSSTAFPR